MSNIDAFANSFPPNMPGIPPVDDFTDGTFPTNTDQPETQGEDALEAELGDDGQGDLDAEGEPDAVAGDAPRDLRDGSE
ncbi:hypothetical protein [Microbacterium sp. Leaf159]|uniref:hypothetical protein n=1 Tax=Microbacterium sp. Leaf159 TaxID=1736279 RepID=UPI0006F5B69C|nr:hypothetical protein [Microbacterium sp. Leaf159]KQR39955.1 hypothetical protein ASF80_11505 [Microbacterium sp. Leaf159]